MSEELQKLQNLGAQKIYEETHIPLKYVQSILHGSFEGFSKVQFIGFVSILEREYNEDLSVLKSEGISHFVEQESAEDTNGIFITPQKKKFNKRLYLILIVVIFIIASLFSFNNISNDSTEEEVVDNQHIEDVQKKIEEMNSSVKSLSDENVTVDDTNGSDLNESMQKALLVEPIEEVVKKSFTIKSKGNVWYGYIDVKTNKHYQGTFKGEKSLDASKELLLLFGHGYIDMYVNGEIQKFKSRDNIRFLYKNNTLKTISLKEFKKLNRGRKW